MPTHVAVGRNTTNPYQLMVRQGVDAAYQAASNLKKFRAVVEARRGGKEGAWDYTPCVALFGMDSAEDVETVYNLLVAADAITTSSEFGALVAYLG